jgi:hypothetical protein
LKTITLHVDYTIGQTVYLQHRQEKLPGMVTGLIVRRGMVAYLVGWGDASESNHFDVELTGEYSPDFDVTA